MEEFPYKNRDVRQVKCFEDHTMDPEEKTSSQKSEDHSSTILFIFLSYNYLANTV